MACFTSIFHWVPKADSRASALSTVPSITIRPEGGGGSFAFCNFLGFNLVSACHTVNLGAKEVDLLILKIPVTHHFGNHVKQRVVFAGVAVSANNVSGFGRQVFPL